MGTTGLTPDSHTVRIFLRVRLDGWSDTTVGITFSKDGVDGTSHDGLVTSLDFSFGVVLWFPWIKWYVVSFGTKFCDAVLQLVERSGNVGQFDDVGFGGLCQFSQV